MFVPMVLMYSSLFERISRRFIPNLLLRATKAVLGSSDLEQDSGRHFYPCINATCLLTVVPVLIVVYLFRSNLINLSTNKRLIMNCALVFVLQILNIPL